MKRTPCSGKVTEHKTPKRVERSPDSLAPCRVTWICRLQDVDRVRVSIIPHLSRRLLAGL